MTFNRPIRIKEYFLLIGQLNAALFRPVDLRTQPGKVSSQFGFCTIRNHPSRTCITSIRGADSAQASRAIASHFDASLLQQLCEDIAYRTLSRNVSLCSCVIRVAGRVRCRASASANRANKWNRIATGSVVRSDSDRERFRKGTKSRMIADGAPFINLDPFSRVDSSEYRSRDKNNPVAPKNRQHSSPNVIVRKPLVEL